MNTLYPLRFEPIFKTMLWGGGRLRPFLNRPQNADPTGEAWVLSDVDGSPSKVANGPLAGRTVRELLAEFPGRILGAAKPVHGRFPLLLKFIDAKQELSVQVHPNDAQADAHTPGAAGKTEAWVVMAADPATSKIYAGFRDGMTPEAFREAMADGTTPATLHQFTPAPGDCVFLRAGTVHAIGADILLFEVQQTSDITFRLYDWDRVDAKTGLPRQLHVEAGLAVSDFAAGPCRPTNPAPHEGRDRLAACEHFTLDRLIAHATTTTGTAGVCKVVVCVAGAGTLAGEALAAGDVVLLPAELGPVPVVPTPGPAGITLLECGVI